MTDIAMGININIRISIQADLGRWSRKVSLCRSSDWTITLLTRPLLTAGNKPLTPGLLPRTLKCSNIKVRLPCLNACSGSSSNEVLIKVEHYLHLNRNQSDHRLDICKNHTQTTGWDTECDSGEIFYSAVPASWMWVVVKLWFEYNGLVTLVTSYHLLNDKQPPVNRTTPRQTDWNLPVIFSDYRQNISPSSYTEKERDILATWNILEGDGHKCQDPKSRWIFSFSS